jgi:hypothetical protein
LPLFVSSGSIISCVLAADQPAPQATAPAAGSPGSAAGTPSFIQIVGQSYAASGFSTVSCSLSAAGVCEFDNELAGRGFHIVMPAGTGAATCQLERKLDGTNWTKVTVNGSAFYAISYVGLSISEDVTEPQSGVPYRMDCGGGANGSYTSGTIPVEFTQ